MVPALRAPFPGALSHLTEEDNVADEPIRYMSVADIAALFEVAPGTVEKWRQRYDNFPVHDAVIGIGHGQPIRGWLPERADEFRAWQASRPGRGAGGGRPRKNDAP